MSMAFKHILTMIQVNGRGSFSAPGVPNPIQVKFGVWLCPPSDPTRQIRWPPKKGGLGTHGWIIIIRKLFTIGIRRKIWEWARPNCFSCRGKALVYRGTTEESCCTKQRIADLLSRRRLLFALVEWSTFIINVTCSRWRLLPRDRRTD